MQNSYKELIFTDHALERLKEREIKKSEAWATWRNPDKSRFSKSKGGRVFTRGFDGKEIEIVAKKNEKSKWIVISVWSRGKKDSDGLFEKIDGKLASFIKKVSNIF